MSIESKKGLPKRYQELADEAGFKAILDSLDASPADMTAVAEVEKEVELVSERLERLVAFVNEVKNSKISREQLTTRLRQDIFEDDDGIFDEGPGYGAVRANGAVRFWICASLLMSAFSAANILFF